MNMEAHEAESVQQGTFTQGAQETIHGTAGDNKTSQPQPQPQLDQPCSTSAPMVTSMDVDSHTSVPPSDSMHVPDGPQPLLVSPTPAPPTQLTLDATHAADQDSTMVTSTEDRIDAVLEGNDGNDADYESSDLESSGDDEGPESSSSSGSDSDLDSDTVMGNKRNKALTIEQREKALIEIDAMDDDADIAPNAILFTANEVQKLPEVKRPDIVLGRDTKLEPIGTVTTIVDSVVVVQASSSGEVRVLDAGTVVVVMKPAEGDNDPIKEVLGEIFETFGPVTRPLYSIRFNIATEIPAICTIGCTAYTIPEHSSFVFTEPLMAVKGSDASNKFDEEVDEIEMEFSDDEKEMEHKQMLKRARNKKGGKERRLPMATDTSAALQAMMGQTPSTYTTLSPRRTPIALPPKPSFDEPVDGYRILQRPGVASHAHPLPQAPAASGTVPWYQQQHRDLQNMIGPRNLLPQKQQQQDKKMQEALNQLQQNQAFQQQLQKQQQQQQQLYRQQQEQQALYQQQIQEAQATIMRLKRQQEQLEQQQVQQAQLQMSQQLPQFSPQTNTSFDVQQAAENSQQQIMNLLSPLFPQSQNPRPPSQ
ncbi:MAG: Gar1/Naf1 RNA binding region-domain-containing protein [Benniella sp.]|nr:MAG: Gar1/Naf1 RNA binding region-domain-containing protein [Benniella sp.]